MIEFSFKAGVFNMFAINPIVSAIHRMEPNGVAVKIYAMIPIVSAVVLVVKEKQLLGQMNENWQHIKELHKKLANTQVEQISGIDEKFILACTNYTQFSSLMTKSPYSFVPRIVCLAALIVLPLNLPAVLGALALLSFTAIPHYSYTFINKTQMEVINEYRKISIDIENRLKKIKT